MWPTSDGGRLERLVVFVLVQGAPTPVGELVFEGREYGQSFFRYARSWLDNREARFALAPVLSLRPRATNSAPHPVPLFFSDAAPDGWGKAVLRFAYPAQTWGMGEFLAAAGDDRTGELLFGPDPSGPERFVPGQAMIAFSEEEASLEALLEAAQAMEQGQPRRRDLDLLFRGSADIGGARPKTRLWREGRSWIAKFPAQGDLFDDPRLEAVCLDLAEVSGIETPNHEVISIAGRSVLLVDRFDRGPAGERYGYMSAGTLVGQSPSDYATSSSYADVAALAREKGIRPCESDLFRRLLFNCFIHNTDDHLRNHAFLRCGGEWRLSPVFDLVPARQGRLVLAPAPGVSPEPDPARAFAAHAQFRLDRSAATQIYEEVVDGLKRLPEVLDRREVTARDRATALAMMPFAANPPVLLG
jgi:serine/threonine-protein kinase HipA